MSFALVKNMDKKKLEEWIKINAIISFARSGGPGGQHVNKTETKAVLKIIIDKLPLTDEEKELIKQRLSGRINSDGELVIHSSEERSQARNRELAEERALFLIMSALVRKRKRRLTKPTKESNERRIKSKKMRAEIKKLRNLKP